MRYQSVCLLAAAAAVSAMPAQMVKRDDWTNDANGNIHIIFSDDKINIGSVQIEDILTGLGNACYTDGSVDTGEQDFNGQEIDGGDVVDIEIKMNPSGSYPTWIHNGLLEALQASVRTVTTCHNETYTPPCANPMVGCDGNEAFLECEVPRYWGINYQDPDAANAAPPAINADLQKEVLSTDFCSTFTTVGGAVAGAVNGVAGGIFTLIGLACEH